MCKNCNYENRYKKVTELDLKIQFKFETGLDADAERNQDDFNNWIKGKLIDERNQAIDDIKKMDEGNEALNLIEHDKIQQIIDNEL